MLWDKANQGRQARYPDTTVVRFVARNFYDAPNRSKIHFLDIGSGRYAPHTKFLEGEGFTVTAIDFSHTALAHHHMDIRAADLFSDETFDCILDFNSLCHVEDPPIEKIYSWLKKDGIFFSVCPRWDTSREHLEGKGFVRCIQRDEITPLYFPFWTRVVDEQLYTVNREAFTSWIIEAKK